MATAIIALTASTLEEERSVVLSAGCDDYMRKPFREADIFEALTKHIGARFVYEEETTQQAPPMVLSADLLAPLPEVWRAELQESVEVLDAATASQLIEQIRPQDGALANALADLVKSYRFDILQELLTTTNSEINA